MKLRIAARARDVARIPDFVPGFEQGDLVADALDAADAMLAESLTGDVKATTASEYTKARERIAL